MEQPADDAAALADHLGAEYFELDERPGDVVERLAGRLLRGSWNR